MPLTSGDKLGPYEILSPLGAGGMGEVYKARDTRLERTVAVKVLPEHIVGKICGGGLSVRRLTDLPMMLVGHWAAGLVLPNATKQFKV